MTAHRDLHREILASPAACILLMARVGLSARKANMAIEDALPLYVSKGRKLFDVMDTTRGRTLKQVAELIADERDDYARARAEEQAVLLEKSGSLAEFTTALIAQSEMIIPGIYHRERIAA